MKILSFLASFLLIFTSCNSQKNAVDASNKLSGQEPKIIQYEAFTRGSFFRAVVENQSISVTRTRDAEPVAIKISDADWAILSGLYKNIDLEGLKNLKAPSQARFYDGAPIASFKVIIDETTYETTSFDGGNPPAEIKAIVDKIIALAQQE